MELRYYGDPILRQKSEPVGEISPEVREFVEEMVVVMLKGGMGLSAVQLGKLWRIFLVMPPVQREDGSYFYDKYRVFINPTLRDPSEETIAIDEGCLSIPGLRGVVERPLEIWCDWTDLSGESHSELLTEWEARIAMHENDHLNGVLYIDRMEKRARRLLDHPLQAIKNRYSKGR